MVRSTTLHPLQQSCSEPQFRDTLTLWVNRAYQKGEIGRRVAHRGLTMDNGAIVHIDYDLYNADSGDIIETTREEVAKEHEVFQEGRTYEPMITVILLQISQFLNPTSHVAVR